jgi:hypothetical protein
MIGKRLVFALGAAAFAIACSSDPLCTSCPDLTGSYQVTFTDDQSTGNCSDFGVGDTSTTMNLTQNGATLNGEMFGFDLTGSLYASGSFSISGNNDIGDGGVDDYASLTMQGTAPLLDAGTEVTTLTGTVQGDFSNDVGSGTDTCTLYKSFTAVQ